MFRLESIFILVFLAIGGTAQAARMSIIAERLNYEKMAEVVTGVYSYLLDLQEET